MKQPAIYIMTNKRHGTLYTGVTSNLIGRVYEHKNNLKKGFTTQYNCKKLVYYELFDDMMSSIAREKQIKGGSRNDKICLINGMNPEWIDLYDSII
jgi:putative endonuclease